MLTRRHLLKPIDALAVANVTAAFAARGPALTSAPLAGHFTQDNVCLGACFDSHGKQVWQHTLASTKTDAGGEPV